MDVFLIKAIKVIFSVAVILACVVYILEWWWALKLECPQT